MADGQTQQPTINSTASAVSAASSGSGTDATDEGADWTIISNLVASLNLTQAQKEAAAIDALNTVNGQSKAAAPEPAAAETDSCKTALDAGEMAQQTAADDEQATSVVSTVTTGASISASSPTHSAAQQNGNGRAPPLQSASASQTQPAVVATALAPAPPRHPIPSLPTTVKAALDAYWDSSHSMCPLIHRASFERALFQGIPTRVYPEPPLALAYAAAACGARSMPRTAERTRFKITFDCVERSRTLLAARPSHLSNTYDDLEAAQSTMLLLDVISPAGMPASTYPVLVRAAKTAEHLVATLPKAVPKTSEEWLYREMVTRLEVGTAAYDLAAASYSGRPTIASYFHHHIWPLPMGERWFDSPDPESAFTEIQQIWQSHAEVPPPASPTGSSTTSSTHAHAYEETMHVHFGEPDAQSIALASVELTAHAFGGNGSVVTLLHLANFQRHLLMFTARADPMMAKQLVAALSTLQDSMRNAVPSELAATAFSTGDPSVLFRSWESYFVRYPHSHSAVQLLLVAESYAIERLLSAGFRSAGLARSLKFATGVRGLLREDRTLRYTHYLIAPSLFKIGTELIKALSEELLLHGLSPPGDRRGSIEDAADAVRAVRINDYKNAIKTIWAALEGLGKKYGLNIRKVADQFSGLATGAGLTMDAARTGLLSLPDENLEEIVRLASTDLQSPVDANASPASAGEAKFFGDLLLTEGVAGLVVSGKKGSGVLNNDDSGYSDERARMHGGGSKRISKS